MDQKRDLTKKLIAESFKELMKQYPFDKITIKMISDKAKMIRPTFYNHFRDKYDLVEWIFNNEVVSEAEKLHEYDMDLEAIKLVFSCMNKEKDFYAKAFAITGQNSFEQVMISRFSDLFKRSLSENTGVKLPDNKLLTIDSISRFYAIGLVTAIKTWLLNEKQDISINELIEAYQYLTEHSIFNIKKR